MSAKPCPFCGREARVYGYPWAYVGCEGRDCILRNVTIGRPNNSVLSAIKLWNRRRRAVRPVCRHPMHDDDCPFDCPSPENLDAPPIHFRVTAEQYADLTTAGKKRKLSPHQEAKRRAFKEAP